MDSGVGVRQRQSGREAVLQSPKIPRNSNRDMIVEAVSAGKANSQHRPYERGEMTQVVVRERACLESSPTAPLITAVLRRVELRAGAKTATLADG